MRSVVVAGLTMEHLVPEVSDNKIEKRWQTDHLLTGLIHTVDTIDIRPP